MERINSIELCDPDIYPSECLLEEILGESFHVYSSLLKLYKANNMIYEWKYYRDGKAWLCKVQYKKRTIVWMSAWKGYIKATVYFPEKYMNDIYGLGISEAALDKIKNTRNTGKSIPCIFEMKTKEVLKDFSTVMRLKVIAT